MAQSLLSYRWCMTGLRKTALAVATLLTTASFAQVSLYSFEQVSATWTPITAANGGYELGTSTTADTRVYVDPAELEGAFSQSYLGYGVGPGFPIGFDFTYNGDVFDRIGISSMGWISFGKSDDGEEAVALYTSDHQAGRPLYHSYNAPFPEYKRNKVCGYGAGGLRAQNRPVPDNIASSFRVATIGTAPNRVCVVQWIDFQTTYDNWGHRICFQIRLNEAYNAVEVVFGPMDWGSGYPAGAPQIGLGGVTNEDFNSRMTVAEEPSFLYDWNNTVASETNTDACTAAHPSPFGDAYSGVYPEVGLTFRWEPPVCAPPTWPIGLSEVSFGSAVLTWSYNPDAVSFEYVVSTENDPDGPVVASGAQEDVSVLITGLEPQTEYYVFVRSICAAGAGEWGLGTLLLTQGGAVLTCGEAAIQQTHCSSQYTSVVWKYSTSNGTSAVRAVFDQGYVGSTGPTPSFRIWYAADTVGTPAYVAGWGDVLPGQVFTSTGPYMTMKLITDAGSCESQPWFTPWAWTVGCLDCTSPLAAFSVVNEDCENLEFDVQVNMVSLGSSSSVILSNDQGVASTTVTAVGVHVVGPFAAGTPVIITMENPVNPLCNVESVPLINAPCPTVDCGPTDYTYCYLNGSNVPRLYQGEGLPVGIRFRSGSTFGSDLVRVYNGVDEFSATPTDLSGDLANELVTSTNDDLALLLATESDAFNSCEDGYATEWDYVVACYDGCTQPTATFAVVPACPNGFNVTVNLTAVGSTGTVTITNDGGALAVSATAIGTYTVGPFASLDEVKIEVVGASALCSWTSPELTYDCSVGIDEQTVGTLQLFPNPSQGILRVVVPEGADGSLVLTVRDMAGRSVAQQTVVGRAGNEIVLDLSHLPDGLYLTTLGHEALWYTGKVNILH